MTAINSRPRAFGVWFSELERWSVGSFIEAGWRWPGEVIRPLADALSRKVIDVDRKATDPNALRMMTLHFTGEMRERESNGVKPIKGRLWWAEPGDVLYSKIDVRNGAIGIVPDVLGRVCVTSEYPVYAVNPEIADARYIKMLFRTDVFRRKINSMISGASGRKRVQPTDLEGVVVPLPPLSVQRKIVAAWEAARKVAATTGTKIEQLEHEIEVRFLADLGLKAPTQAKHPKAFGLRWSQIDRWGVELAWRFQNQPDTFKYEAKSLGDICRTGTGGTPSRKRPEYFGGGIPWVKTSEVRHSVITTTEETLSDEGMANCQAKLYPIGSIIMAMYGQGATRGRTAKLGVEAATNQACLVMTHFVDGLLPDYLWFYLMARYDDIRSLASGNNQPNLSAELVHPFPVPIPPLSVQRQIVARIAKRRAEIATLKADAKARADAAKIEVEAMILGERRL